MKNLSKFLISHLEAVILIGVALICLIFCIFGSTTEEGYRTLDGKEAKIEEYTENFIEDANAALNRLMNEDRPTDDDTIKENEEEATGQGFTTSLDAIIGRRLADGNNDNGNGWQCSRYTGYLATGKWSYSKAHPDYGPVNGKDVAAWLVKNYGFKYIDKPVMGAIGSGGFNTTYGHTVMYLYPTGTNTAMVNDANYVPLTVNTHNMNISGWVWVVPGDYEPKPEPAPAPTPEPISPAGSGEIYYTYKKGDTFGQVLVNLGLSDGRLWGVNGTVRYYTEQLHKQGIWGNIPIGTTIKLAY